MVSAGLPTCTLLVLPRCQQSWLHSEAEQFSWPLVLTQLARAETMSDTNRNDPPGQPISSHWQFSFLPLVFLLADVALSANLFRRNPVEQPKRKRRLITRSQKLK